MRIAVFCGSSRRSAETFLAPARRLGSELGRRGHRLVYGGGRTGLMGAVADAALTAGGAVEGVILREFIEQDVHHLGIDELYAVDDMRARKAGLDSRADAFVAMPGGYGTLEELTEILSFRKLQLHHRVLVLLDTAGFFEGLRIQISRAVEEGFDDREALDYLRVTDDPVVAIDLCEAALGD